ncbi:MAG TPA: Hpt domain-containing protein [Thermoguttaceae bacterium]|nr:Hpt domain-containing protein [Thermoguttaceae bacterium]
MDRRESEEPGAVFDVQELLDRCLGNVEFAERILEKFLLRFDVDLAEMEQAAMGEDPEFIARVAHRLKGASAAAAAHGLQERTAEIEELAVQRCTSDIPERLKDLRSEWSRFAECARLSGLPSDSGF